jgi:hypothetical protein
MTKSRAKFIKALETSNETIHDIIFLTTTRLKSTFFTRKSCKLKFEDLIFFMLNLNKKTLQIELDNFMKNIKGAKTLFTKQAFSEARQKISPNAFIYLKDAVIKKIYKDEGDYDTFRGYRLTAIDGSTLELQNTEELRNHFGFAENMVSKVARARVSGLYDVENKIMIDAQIGHYKTSEREYAVMHIKKLKELGIKKDLILFDRGYPSKDLIYLLNEEGIDFVMRVTTSFMNEVNTVKSDDEIVELVIKKKTIKLRVIKVILKTGEVETLISSLQDSSFAKEDFKALYFKRWGIEVKYDEIKNVLQLENFTGDKPISVEQDFHATIYLSMMASLAEEAANDEIEKRNEDKELKHQYKVNMNILIGKLKDDLILMTFQWNPVKRVKMFNKIMEEISRNVVPIRPDRSCDRNTAQRRDKYPMNKRSGL